MLFLDFEKTFGPVRKEILYNILIEFIIPMKLVRLFKMSAKGTRINSAYVKILLIYFLFRMV
jgi:hypothetical protein